MQPDNLNDYLDWFYDPIIALFEHERERKLKLARLRRRLRLAYGGLAVAAIVLLLIRFMGVESGFVLGMSFLLCLFLTALFVLVEK